MKYVCADCGYENHFGMSDGVCPNCGSTNIVDDQVVVQEELTEREIADLIAQELQKAANV